MSATSLPVAPLTGSVGPKESGKRAVCSSTRIGALSKRSSAGMQGMLHVDDDVEEEFEIDINDAEPEFLKGQSQKSGVEVSPVKIVANPDGSLQVRSSLSYIAPPRHAPHILLAVVPSSRYSTFIIGVVCNCLMQSLGAVILRSSYPKLQ